MGEETDGVVESVSKLQEKVKSITGVSLLDESGAYRDTYEILRDLAEVWDEVGQKDPKGQAAVLELLAGKNRSNALAAILSNLSDLEGAYDAALQAEGSAQQELDTYLMSIQGRIDKFTNAVQTMWMNAISSDIIKGFVDFGTKLINILDNMNSAITPIGSLVVVVSILFGLIKGAPILMNKLLASMSKEVLTRAANTKAITTESTARMANTAAVTAETAAINANTAAQIANNKAHAGEVFDIIPDNIGSKVDDLGELAGQMSFFDNAADSADAAKTVIEEVTEEAVEAGTKTAAAAGGLSGLFSKVGAFFATTLGKVTLAGLAIGAVLLVIDKLTVSFKESQQALKDATDELKSTNTEIEQLNSDLKTTKARIDELKGKDSLTVVEEEELNKLKQTNAELERNIAIKEREAALQKDEQIKTAIETYNKDTSFMDQYIPAQTSGAADAPVLHEQENIGTEFERRTKTAEEYQDKIADLSETETKLYDVWEKAKKADTETKKWPWSDKSEEQKAYEAAKKEREEAEKLNADNLRVLQETIATRQETYGQLEWETGKTLTESQKTVNEILTQHHNDINKYLIATDTTGKAIANAFEEVANRPMFEGLLDDVEDLSLDEFDLLLEGSEYDGFLQALTDSGVIASESAEEIEKLYNLIIQTSEATDDLSIADKKLERSQKRLRYYELYKELNKYAKQVKEANGSLIGLNRTERDRINDIRTEMTLLAKEISQYDILSDTVKDAKQAFEDFENAQNADAESDRLESASDMFKAIIDGFHSAELGSETFKAAMAGLVPESVYSDLDTLEEKYDAIWKYMNEDLNRYFTLEYDDEGLLTSVEVTTADVERFIQSAKDKGLMSFTDGVWTVNETDFKKFAESMGITESALYAIAVQMDKIDADHIMGDYSTFLQSFDMGTESDIYNIVKGLADIDQQLLDGKISVQEYGDAYLELNKKLNEASEQAVNDVVAYQEASNQVDILTQKVQEATNKLNEMNANKDLYSEQDFSSANLELTNLISDLQAALQLKHGLEVPSEILITLALDTIQTQIAEVESSLVASGGLTVPLKLESGEVNDSLIVKDLETGKYTVAVTPEVQELSPEDKASLDNLVTLYNNQNTINMMVTGGEDSASEIEKVTSAADEATKAIKAIPDPDVDTRRAINAVNNLKTEIESIEDKTVTITTVRRTVREDDDDSDSDSGKSSGLKLHSSGRYQGTAHAKGDWGLKKNEKNALLGELGQEMVGL